MGYLGGSNRKTFGLSISLAIASFCTVSCSLTNPELVVGDLPAMELDSNSKYFKGRNFKTTTIQLGGKVSPLVTGIQLSFDQGASWVNPNSTSIASFAKTHAPASDGNTTFKVSVSQIGNLNDPFANTAFGQEATVWVRGTGEFGNTAHAEFKVLRTNYQSYGVVSIANRGAVNTTFSGGQLKVRGGQIISRKPEVVVVGQLRGRGGLQ